MRRPGSTNGGQEVKQWRHEEAVPAEAGQGTDLRGVERC